MVVHTGEHSQTPVEDTPFSSLFNFSQILNIYKLLTQNKYMQSYKYKT